MSEKETLKIVGCKQRRVVVKYVVGWMQRKERISCGHDYIKRRFIVHLDGEI